MNKREYCIPFLDSGQNKTVLVIFSGNFEARLRFPSCPPNVYFKECISGGLRTQVWQLMCEEGSSLLLHNRVVDSGQGNP